MAVTHACYACMHTTNTHCVCMHADQAPASNTTSRDSAPTHKHVRRCISRSLRCSHVHGACICCTRSCRSRSRECFRGRCGLDFKAKFMSCLSAGWYGKHHGHTHFLHQNVTVSYYDTAHVFIQITCYNITKLDRIGPDARTCIRTCVVIHAMPAVMINARNAMNARKLLSCMQERTILACCRTICMQCTSCHRVTAVFHR